MLSIGIHVRKYSYILKWVQAFWKAVWWKIQRTWKSKSVEMSLPFCVFCRLVSAPKSSWLPSWHLPHGIGITCLGIFLSRWTEISASVSSVLVVVQLPSHVGLCDPMNCSTPGFPVLHYLPEFAQTHVHWTSDAIQLAFPLSPLLLLPPIIRSIGFFSSESALRIMWPEYWSISFSTSPSTEYSLISLQSKGLPRVSSNTTVQEHQFFGTQLSSQSNSHIHTWLWKNHSFDYMDLFW